ncbi:MAG: PorT family protein [Bacteroidales bacterium]|nr:PorT family protein [Bacteroidales bacterium]
MKKFFILFICLFLIGESMEAQNFKGGIRAGFTATQMSGDELRGFHKLGAFAGGFVTWRFVQNGKWAIQPEINFIMKGSSTFLRANKEGNIGEKYVLSLYFIEVPFFAKYNIVRGLEFELGLAMDVLLYGVEKDANGKIPARQPFRTFGMTGIAGFSYLFANHYGLNLRYGNSLIPLRVPDGEYGNYRITKKQFSSEIVFSFYYQF